MYEDAGIFRVIACGGQGKGHACAHRADGELQCWGLVYLADGKGFYSTEAAGRWNVHSGDAFFLLPGQGHSYGPEGDNYWEEKWLLFEGSLIDRLHTEGTVREWNLPARNIRRFGIDNLFSELLSSSAAGNPMSARPAQAAALAIISAATAILTASVPEVAGGNLVASILEEMRTAVGRPFFNFQQSSRQTGYSATHLRRLFKAYTGQSPVAYFNALKLAAARNALLSTSKSIKRIAAELGFSDEAYFRRVFRKAEGMPPSEYRKRFRMYR
ncbi:MAG: AraC family transcriptional regulator [bacterium]|jgi:AraC-like DNA-binding protein|nr:AraC family transcriptional regulator [bacterium]MDD3806017.1 AraC family transcriptional regulator [bacterium]MDD4152223.1 AraC family transcriptional regulator [bacterium]